MRFQDELQQLQTVLSMSNGDVLEIAREITQTESGYEDMRSIDRMTVAERDELLRTMRALACCAIA